MNVFAARRRIFSHFGIAVKRYFYPLDALRFGAALSVVFFHLAFYDWVSDTSTTARAFGRAARFEFLAPWTWFGWIGVQIFFVISGFVIANSANGSTPMAFAQARIARLYPAAAACAIITAIALVTVVGASISSLALPFIKSILLIPRGPWIDGIYWTLAVEIVFYCLIFYVLVLGKFGSIRFIAWGLTVWSGAFLLAVLLHAPGTGSYWGGIIKQDSDILLLRHGCFFAVGLWLWLASRSLRPSVAVGLLLAISASCGEIYLCVCEDFANGIAWSTSAAAPMALWLASVALIFVASRNLNLWTPRSESVRQGLRRVGAMTYPLYLVHNVAGAAFCRLLITRGVDPVLALVLAISTMIAISYLICTFWEPIMRRRLRGVMQQLADGIRSHSKQLEFLFAPGGACR